MIIDTNALSDYLEGNDAVIAFVDSQPTIEIPVIVIGEYRFGLLGSRHRDEYEKVLARFILDAHVLMIDETTAEYYAALRMLLRLRGQRIPSNDLWIAALARQHHLPILSQDAHFDRVEGVERFGW